jgi:hypothetical protein
MRMAAGAYCPLVSGFFTPLNRLEMDILSGVL